VSFSIIGVLAPLPGDPSALDRDVTDLERSTRALAEATEILSTVAFDGRGQAIEALRVTSEAGAADLRRAHSRYQGTSAALRVYVVVLASAHVTAARAVEINDDARVRFSVADRDLDEARRDQLRVRLAGGSQAQLEDAEEAERRARLAIRRAEDLGAEAGTLYSRAVAEVDQAARTAIAAINASFGQTNDSDWDEISAVLAPLGDFLKSFAEWVGGFLKSVLELVVAVVALVVVALLLVLVVVVVIALLVIVLVVAIEVLAYVLAVLGAAIFLWALTELLGVDDLTQLRLITLFVGIALPPIGLYILGTIRDDVNAPTPEVREVSSEADLEARNTSERWAYGDLLDHDDAVRNNSDTLDEGGENPALAHAPGSPADRISVDGMLDRIGKDGQTVVSIERVVGVDGVERWVITLPSTQDWNAPGAADAGAVNDNGGNLTMLLTPELASQYERAVLVAMEKAGITSDDPIMFVGFSQGGILAGLMAQKHSDEYNVQAVLVAGAPIEAFRIPGDVSVLAVEHVTDLVPVADMHVGPNPSNVVTITGGSEYVNPTVAHNPDLYAKTLAEADAASGGDYSDMFSAFQPGTGTGDWERHLYAFSE
jgi:hypothetical protein